jgi:hypothetical protein
MHDECGGKWKRSTGRRVETSAGRSHDVDIKIRRSPTSTGVRSIWTLIKGLRVWLQWTHNFASFIFVNRALCHERETADHDSVRLRRKEQKKRFIETIHGTSFLF